MRIRKEIPTMLLGKVELRWLVIAIRLVVWMASRQKGESFILKEKENTVGGAK
jgi:hypothetical protein